MATLSDFERREMDIKTGEEMDILSEYYKHYEAYYIGWDAFYDRKDIEKDNPYSINDSEEFNQWRNGFEECKKESNYREATFEKGPD